MKPHDHGRRLKEVYAHIYQDRYQFKPGEVANATALLAKNLDEMGLSPNDVRGRNVLNMGTGRETLAFHGMGAERIYHFDISDVPVSALTRLSQSDDAFANIRSRRLDMCGDNDLECHGGLDFVYLVGILQHLHDPEAALVNIFPYINKGARFFFRNYRSGTLHFLCVEIARQVIPHDVSDAFSTWFHSRYPDFRLNDDRTHQDVLTRLYTSLYDHLFVPVLNLYDPKEVNAYFVNHGFEVTVDQDFPLYDHEADLKHGGIGVSLYFRKTAESMTGTELFPTPIVQSEIPYRQETIKETLRLMRAFVDRAGALGLEERFAVITDIYFSTWSYVLYTFYNSAGNKPEPGFEITETVEATHHYIQAILKKACA